LLSPFCATTKGVHPVAWHDPYEQLLWQVATPEQLGMPGEQVVVLPGAHVPCPVQVPKAGHWQLDEHVRDWVPQLPQAWLVTAPGAQTP
jgi:hypothetical protein